MPNWIIYGMIYAGSALMVWNIFQYVRFARRLQGEDKWGKERRILYFPIFLLVMFLFGYLAIGIFSQPDLIMSGILFGGSVFVFVMLLLIQRIASHIQETERLEAELKASEESNRVKSSFLSNMSHEMRTPLNAIMGLDTLALKNPSLPEEAREQLEKVGISAKHLLELINNILDMNAIEQGSLALKQEGFSLKETLALVDIIARHRCEEKGLTFENSVVGSLDDYYVGDEMMLKHVLLNLLDNAVKFTAAPGTVSFTAEQLSAEGPERELRFTVQDTGIGMDEALQASLFKPFVTGDESSTSRYGGSGLGLALSQRIAGLMRGEITVESKKDQGSAFFVTVRLGASDRKKESGAEAETPLRNMHVLIVEDIDLNAEIVADLLDMEGVTSERAENGKIAVDMFSQNPPGTYDAILMDLRMPVMDGITATRAIRELERPDAKTVPIMALTANAFDEDVRNSMAAGMDAHMAKPVDPDLLFDNLRHLVPERKEPHA